MFLNTNLAILAGVLSATAVLGFEELSLGALTDAEVAQGRISASAGSVEVINGKARTGDKALRLLGGEEKSLTYSFKKAIEKEAELEFWMQRWSSAGSYKVTVNAQDEKGKLTLLETISKQATGSYNKRCQVQLPKGTAAIVITATTPLAAGVLLDDFMLHIGPMVVKNVSVENPGLLPIMKRATINPAVHIKVTACGKDGGIDRMRLKVSPAKSVEAVTLRVGDAKAYQSFQKDGLIFTARPDENGIIIIEGDKIGSIPSGNSNLWLDVKPSKSAKVGSEITFSDIEVQAGKKSYKQKEDITQPVGFMVARNGQAVKLLDGGYRNSAHFRIPGLITSKKSGDLVSIFDARWLSGADLSADIDVATSISKDGGQTWSPVKVIMDIGEGAANGVGDPCILQDATGRIWVQAIGAHFYGKPLLFKSATGNDPKTTAQWYMTYSDDDGKTWAKDLVNPTKQIKKDEWNCILAGPGSGITTSKGVIVFPAQIWQNGQKLNCRSTICYSLDNGKNWVYGTGLPRRTSECVAVELEDGSIMLNARDESRSGKRAVYITHDLGKTWIAHETNLNTLEEPVCQASLIKIDSKKYGKLLLFSNPKVGLSHPASLSRHTMSIRFSKDEGKTWSKGYLYDTRVSAGYSSLSMIDEDTIGVLYESPVHNFGGHITSINFQRIALKDIIEAK